jgi:hypothetical protein
MKIFSVLFILFSFIFFSCIGKNTHNDNNNSISTEGDVVNINVDENIKIDEYLYIGGKRTNYKLSELDSYTSIYLDLNTINGSKSFEGIELLKNLHSLTINGMYIGHPLAGRTDLSRIDFLPLNSMENLEGIYISYAIFSAIPDLGQIPSLEHLSFWNCEIKSMNGIENTKQIHKFSINFLYSIPENLSMIFELTNLDELNIEAGFLLGNDREKILFRMSDMSKMTELRRLEISYNYYLDTPHYQNIDLDGIQNLSQLESLSLINIMAPDFQFISGLNNLDNFSFSGIHHSVVSFDFLNSLINLSSLYMYGNENIIDITLLINMRKLEEISLLNFTIVNFHILDNLPELKNASVQASKFSPENNNKLKYAEVVYEYDYNDH